MYRVITLGALILIACGGGATTRQTAQTAYDGGLPALDALPPTTEFACGRAASSACGGNLVGTWKLAGLCVRNLTVQQLIDKYGDQFSPGASKCGMSADVPDTGYARFRGDGTWQIDEMTGISIGFSESCLWSIGQSCAGIQAYVSTEAGAPPNKTCQSVGGLCSCSVMENSHPNFGTYITDADSYHLYDSSGSDNAVRQYCVQGDTISVFAPSNAIGGGGVAVAVRSNEEVTDLDASITLPRLDASADVPRADAGPDGPTDTKDSSPDRPVGDAPVDAKVVDAPRSNDSASPIDARPVDVDPVDASPLSLDALQPASAAACQLAAAAPCGGNVKGNWKISSICDPWLGEAEYVASLQVNCASFADLPLVGTAAFNADGSCSLNQTTYSEVDYPVSCLTGIDDTCSARNQRFKNAIGTKDIVAASCTLTSSTVCHCEDVYQYPASGNACTYATSSTELTFITPPAAFSKGAYDYCVQGNVMTIFVAPTSAVGMVCNTCTAGYVLVRAD